MRVLFATAAVLMLGSPAALGGDGGAGGGDPEVTIAHPSKRAFIARAKVDPEEASRVEIGLRLIGRTIDGKRELVDTKSGSEDVEPGPATVEVGMRFAVALCYPYARCELRTTVTQSPLTPPVPPATEATPGEPTGSDSATRKVPTGEPKVETHHIPYGKTRRHQMAAYSKRHYGEREWRLESPRGIVEHYTASATAGPALQTFIQNRPDVEYGELPGVCAQYLIDRDGTIMELVPTDIRCRHTVGLNHETIGIEHVGQSDADVVGRPQVLKSSLALTSWLRCAYGMERSNVIGHNESLDSPLYKELDPDFQGRTHGDMKPGTMKGYRKKIADC